MSVAQHDYSMVIGGVWVESESGERFEATSPATGEVLGTVPNGTRDDAQRAIAAANVARRDWAARSAFERAAAMERVAVIVEERRDDLARTLTLDQGKPLHAEAYDEVDELVAYWRTAAADATRIAGSMPPSVDAAKRILQYRVPRGVVGVITPWNWPYTMPAEVIAPALAAGNVGRLGASSDDVGLRGEARRVHRRRRAAGRRLLDGARAGAGRRRRGGSRARARTRSRSSGRWRPGCRWPHGPPARRRCSSSAGTGRWSCSTTPTSRPPPRRVSPRRSSAPVRAARPASASSCTTPSTTSSWRPWRRRSLARSVSVTRSLPTRRWAR